MEARWLQNAPLEGLWAAAGSASRGSPELTGMGFWGGPGPQEALLYFPLLPLGCPGGLRRSILRNF